MIISNNNNNDNNNNKNDNNDNNNEITMTYSSSICKYSTRRARIPSL